MAKTAPARVYAGAAIIYPVAAVLAGFMVLSPLETPPSGMRSAESLLRNLIFIGVAGVSAAISCRLLRPVARRLAPYQYFLRPFIMGGAVVVFSHVLFAFIGAAMLQAGQALTPEPYLYEAHELVALVMMLAFGGFTYAIFVTLPLGILAAYCVEITGWFRDDAQSRRRGHR